MNLDLQVDLLTRWGEEKPSFEEKTRFQVEGNLWKDQILKR